MNSGMDLVRGTARLCFDSVEGVTHTVEKMHRAIATTPMRLVPGAEPGAGHTPLSAGVYSIIRGVNRSLREVLDGTFSLVPGQQRRNSRGEIRTLAALNGIVGDHLEATGNPLAIAMTLRTQDAPLQLDRSALAQALPDATGHLVVLVHGLSLSELSWQRGGGVDLGSKLQADLGYTSLYLRYNTGRHISTNGREFADMLQALCDAWPVPLKTVSLVGHSMGGLVIRSACWYARQRGAAWLEPLQRIVCLGTPHHGSPLEKAGHAFESTLQAIPYAEPLLLGKLRSAGIKDLRHGALRDEDWQTDGQQPGNRQVHGAVPLVPGVEYYFAAASIGRDQFDPLGHLLGDMLVRPDSAVGLHRDELRRLNIKPENCRVFHETNHFDLLDDARVHEQVIDWFTR